MSDERHNEDETPRVVGPGGDDAPFVYANVVNMNIGPFDVTMDFGYQGPEDRREAVSEKTNPNSTRVVRIAMSHAHAKSMIPIIAGLVANLESNLGTIPTPGFEEKSKE